MPTEIDTSQNESVNNRVDDLAQPAMGAQKAVFKVAPAATTASELIDQVKSEQEQFRKAAASPKATLNIPVADLNNLKLKPNAARDFSTMSEEDVYNLDIPMSARPFSSEDSLKVNLKDTNYIARWVNKDARRLGTMIGRGFSYVTKEDLVSDLELEVHIDAVGHYVLGDVICMKVQKERYFAALRAAHLRAINAVDPKGAHKAAIAQAAQFIDKETAGGYSAESVGNKMKIYSPDFQI